VISVGIGHMAQQTVMEAPAGFDMPTLSDNPGSQSVSSLIAESLGGTFAIDQDQWSTVLSFLADAYLMEMGVLSRLRPNELTVCEVNNGVQDIPNDLGLANTDHFAQFVRGTKAPSRDNALAATPDAQAGHDLFISIGCVTCQVETQATAPVGTRTNGGTYRVPGAICNNISQPFGGFLLHDVGTGDGIVQAGPQDTANKLGTAPSWGLDIRSRLMHDPGSLTWNGAMCAIKARPEALRRPMLRCLQPSVPKPYVSEVLVDVSKGGDR
jgi:CxxC motif-containing protein (DUF1111 family)